MLREVRLLAPEQSMSRPAGISPSRNASTIAIRVGWANAWKISALNCLRALCTAIIIFEFRIFNTAAAVAQSMVTKRLDHATDTHTGSASRTAAR